MSLYHEGFTQNREISWLRYNERVLEEALDNSVPLFERLKYVQIFDNNLEEFFRVRVGTLINAENDNEYEIDEKSGLSAKEQLDEIEIFVRGLIKKKDHIYLSLESELSKHGIKRANISDLKQSELIELEKYFYSEIKDKISTRILKDESDFSLIDENELYLIAELEADNSINYGIIKLPSSLNSLYVIDYGLNEGDSIKYILTEHIIKHFISKVFFPFLVRDIFSFDIARNAEVIGIEKNNILSEMKDVVEKRKISKIDKLFIESKASTNILNYLKSNMNLDESQVYFSDRISLSFVNELEEIIPERLKPILLFQEAKQFNQLKIGKGSILERIKREDLLSHYPYDSMDPFLQLLRESAIDESVNEIRLTIYRLSSHPEIIEHLINAANNGKEVNILIELRARFDEKNNIDWAEKLRLAGCNVYYGSKKYKVHSKICQIVLNKGFDKKYITQLSTGNYNEKTAKLYTDFSLITYDQRIGKSVDEFWKDLINKEVGKYEHILTAPKTLKKDLLHLIERETAKGSEGRIFIKVNSLSDEEIIEALMKASCAGCKIRMIVRGICCLLPNIPNCTENIEIVNVVGRYLEHSRVYIFGQGIDEAIYLSSADLMSRNMNKRVEIAFPIYNKKLKNRIKSIMYLNFIDNVKGRKLDSHGEYIIKNQNKYLIDSQTLLNTNK